MHQRMLPACFIHQGSQQQRAIMGGLHIGPTPLA